MQNTIKYSAFVLLAAVITFSGCRKIFNLPDEKSYLSTQADYTTKAFAPILGRTTLYNGIFLATGSTFPMTFEVKNPRFGDGRDASDMLTKKPTLVWNAEYSGKETSLAQIEAKRHLENHPILEIRGSGDIIWWYTATRDFIKPSDSAQYIYPQSQRYFDVKITNSGGTRTIKNLTITPSIDIPYEPHTDYNAVTGKPNTTTPGGKILVHQYPTQLSKIRNINSNAEMSGSNPTSGLVYVYIRKFTDVPGGVPDPNGHRLRFKFLDKDSVAIDPRKFGATKWMDQVHGFTADGTKPGYTQTPTYVEYNVAYPIPLARIPTKYTAGGVESITGGDWAEVNFSFTRTAFGNVLETGNIKQDFKIFEKGDWEIVFHFKTANPKFEND